jgi:peptidyl-prolyl cis-trans isomerase C/foldase protein PrsA
MRDLFRKQGGRCAPAALGLFLFLTFACRRAAPPPPPPPPAAAVVNGAAIPLSRVQLELDRVRRGEDGETKVEPQDLPKLARALLDGLIDRSIVLQRAKVAGLQVSEAEVQRATEALANDARKGGAAWNEHLAKAGQNTEQLSDELREEILAAKYVSGETRSERASPAETRAFYDSHIREFEDPEAVHCLQIVVRTPDEAKSVLDQLRAGASFDKLARQVSTSPDGRNGGDVGWFPKGTMPKVFDDACFSLGIGKISGVVASPYGFHVFKVLGRRSARVRSFKEAKTEAERRATAEKRAQAEREFMGQLRGSAVVKVNESSFALLH